jgi:glycosyltransferase involved in cell wall biosynthesis
VVLNTLGGQRLSPELRNKVTVVLQSCSARQTWPLARQSLRVLMVGHLRAEKSPQTYFEAVRQLADRRDIRFDHIGQALDPTLGQQAQDLMRRCPQYRWLGGRPHAEVRRRIQRAGVLVHPSRMEGGAHVVIEAVRSGTAVLASGIDGNLGLLGEDYDGYFPVGDATALAHLIASARDVPGMLEALRAQSLQKAARFDPSREKAALLALINALLHP